MNQPSSPRLQGLTAAQAARALAEHGPNALPEAKPVTVLQRLVRQFRSPLICILLVALLIDLGIWIAEGAKGVPVESLAIALILLINAGLGVYQESKAEAALARLKKLATSLVWVMRDDKLQHLAGTERVPGDVVRVEAGDRVPADGALLEAQGVMVDESILTGKSMPVDKDIGVETFSSTLMVHGKGYAELRGEGGQILAQAEAMALTAGVACVPHVSIGAAAEEIAPQPAKQGCDAIVMGPRGRGGVVRPGDGVGHAEGRASGTCAGDHGQVTGMRTSFATTASAESSTLENS